MLQRLNAPLDEELYSGCGLWAPSELERMNQSFVAAVEQAFANGGESRAAAAATVQIKSSLNGSRRLAIDGALGAAWDWFVGVKFEATAVEVVARVRASCASVTAEQVRVEFKKRLCGSDGVVR